MLAILDEEKKASELEQEKIAAKPVMKNKKNQTEMGS